ncbi:unnamed protein product [Phytomonas sp. EM1]|nr:unnamed protein product [Phytomonas sp. EM1]|eukprot:CCW61446.1 unnamed protein product [Phytomonas sp. isolate EM1]
MCAIKDQVSGKTIGHAQMACRVLTKDVLNERRSRNPSGHESTALSSVQSKPYIIRVVVDRVEDKTPAQDMVKYKPPSDAKNPSHRRQSDVERKDKANTLWYTLQYNVAYQLQSISEFIATTLKHEHERLNKVQLSSNSKELEVGIAKSVEYTIKLSNIILQISNQLAEDGNTSSSTRDLPREVETVLKRNPVNKLPVPSKGSVAHFAMYDILFQLQCVGANLSYVTLAYRKALEIPLDTLSKQHQKFCYELDHTIQLLNRQLNILIQSAVDGRLESTIVALPTVDEGDSSASSTPNAYSTSDSSTSSTSQSSSLDECSLSSAIKSPKSSSTSLPTKATLTQVLVTPIKTQKSSNTVTAASTSSSVALPEAETVKSQLSNPLRSPMTNTTTQFKPFQSHDFSSYQQAILPENLASPPVISAHGMNSSPLLANAIPPRIHNAPPAIPTPTLQTQSSEPTDVIPPPFPIPRVVESPEQKTATLDSVSDVAPAPPLSPTQIGQGLIRPTPSTTPTLPVPVSILPTGGFSFPSGAHWPRTATPPEDQMDSPHSESSYTSID